MKPYLAFTLIAATLILSSSANEKWTSLFNGESLDGWIQRGGKAKYTVEDGCIVGRTIPKTPNSFLCTEKQYGDFILEYEFKVDPRLNSGVQIRSQTKESGRVFGYQVEIDPDTNRNRMWTGGIYDEARRGWLNDLSKKFKEENNCLWNFFIGNIEDNSFLDEIIKKYKPKYIVHLAAQAGVRYSIENPKAYINSNIVGFSNIIDCFFFI